MASDTIFALASAAGKAGVAVIRLSGPDAYGVGRSLSLIEPRPRQAHYVTLKDGDDIIDQGLLVYFPGPNSFTGEECLELHVHGSQAVLERIYGTLRAHGLRLADPGEFSRRAFENNKVDLVQIEALADLIDAQSESQRRQALGQMRGALGDKYRLWYDQLMTLMAQLEVYVDFPDEDLPQTLLATISETIITLKADLSGALDKAKRFVDARDGYHIVILGPPNAGKSSLFNRFLGDDRAIVTPVAGTTRDILESTLTMGIHRVVLLDTAGMRESADTIEQEGVRRAKAAGQKAHFRLWVEDKDLPSLEDFAAPFGPDDWRVINKCDTETDEFTRSQSYVFSVSALTGYGFDRLTTAISERVSERLSLSDFPAATRQRHLELLSEVIEHLSLSLIELYETPELSAERIRQSLRAFDKLFGRYDVEEVLGRIFSGFCIGK